MSNFKAVPTPALANVPISSDNCPSKSTQEEKVMKSSNYRGLIGNLN